MATPYRRYRGNDDRLQYPEEENKEDGYRILFEDATRAVCGYCADPERWTPATKGTYPEWWHTFHTVEGGTIPTVRNRCTAWALHFMREKATKA